MALVWDYWERASERVVSECDRLGAVYKSAAAAAVHSGCAIHSLCRAKNQTRTKKEGDAQYAEGKEEDDDDGRLGVRKG